MENTRRNKLVVTIAVINLIVTLFVGISMIYARYPRYKIQDGLYTNQSCFKNNYGEETINCADKDNFEETYRKVEYFLCSSRVDFVSTENSEMFSGTCYIQEKVRVN